VTAKIPTPITSVSIRDHTTWYTSPARPEAKKSAKGRARPYIEESAVLGARGFSRERQDTTGGAPTWGDDGNLADPEAVA
jgi:hypothetical protein